MLQPQHIRAQEGREKENKASTSIELCLAAWQERFVIPNAPSTPETRNKQAVVLIGTRAVLLHAMRPHIEPPTTTTGGHRASSHESTKEDDRPQGKLNVVWVDRSSKVEFVVSFRV